MLERIKGFFCSAMDVLNSVTILAEELPSVLIGGIRCPNQECNGYLIVSPATQVDYVLVASPVAPVTLVCTRCGHQETY